jgi:3-hydroxyacyl-CoA dehydrogenase/enoyl-CoA hydratase/3-hydroxybutyryl-CoA epimerase
MNATRGDLNMLQRQGRGDHLRQGPPAADRHARKNLEKATQELFERHWRADRRSASSKPAASRGSAINGTCMGGGVRTGAACHGRVAANSDKVKIALPEVKVGIFPGAGGTQRVPRLADTQSALQMLTSGQTLTAAEGQGYEPCASGGRAG